MAINRIWSTGPDAPVGTKATGSGGTIEDFRSTSYNFRNPTTNYAEVVSDSRYTSGKAVKFYSASYGNRNDDTGLRCEQVPTSGISRGRWYAFRGRLATPSNYQYNYGWALGMQIKSSSEGYPTFSMETAVGDFDMRLDDCDDSSRPLYGTLPRGVTSDLVMAWYATDSSSSSWVEAWRDGTKVIPRQSWGGTHNSGKNAGILVSGDSGGYIKMGVYRRDNQPNEAIHFWGDLALYECTSSSEVDTMIAQAVAEGGSGGGGTEPEPEPEPEPESPTIILTRPDWSVYPDGTRLPDDTTTTGRTVPEGLKNDPGLITATGTSTAKPFAQIGTSSRIGKMLHVHMPANYTPTSGTPRAQAELDIPNILPGVERWLGVWMRLTAPPAGATLPGWSKFHELKNDSTGNPPISGQAYSSESGGGVGFEGHADNPTLTLAQLDPTDWHYYEFGYGVTKGRSTGSWFRLLVDGVELINDTDWQSVHLATSALGGLIFSDRSYGLLRIGAHGPATSYDREQYFGPPQVANTRDLVAYVPPASTGATVNQAISTETVEPITPIGGSRQTFPAVTTVIDSFDRANETPPAGWNGPAYGADTTLALVDSQVTGSTSSYNSGWWTATTYLDVEVSATIATKGSGSHGIFARMSSPGASPNAYNLSWSSAGTLSLRRVASGSFASSTLLASQVTRTMTAGDRFGIRCRGSIIEGWIIQGSLEPERVFQVNDSGGSGGALPAGYVGLTIEGNTGRIDRFQGGVLGVAPLGQPVETDTPLPIAVIKPSAGEILRIVGQAEEADTPIGLVTAVSAPLPAPADFAVEPGNGYVDLSCTAPEDPGVTVTHIQFLRSTASSGPFSQVGPDVPARPGDVARYRDTAVSNGRTYYYVARSVSEQ